jgi:hypothetical protein
MASSVFRFLSWPTSCTKKNAVVKLRSVVGVSLKTHLVVIDDQSAIERGQTTTLTCVHRKRSRFRGVKLDKRKVGQLGTV